LMRVAGGVRYRCKTEQGFTLLELLVAFVVAATALVAIIQAFTAGMRNLARTEDVSLAALVAESRLAEIGTVYPVTTAEYASEGPEAGFDWSIRIEPYADTASLIDLMLAQLPEAALEPAGEEASPKTLYLVSVRVTWGEASSPSVFALQSLRVGQPL